MANLVTDSSGKPSPQYLSEDGSRYEYQQGKNGALNVNIKGLDIKNVTTTGNITNVVPTQIVDNQVNVVNKFTSELVQKEDVIFTPASRTGESISSAISTNKAANMTLLVHKTSGNEPITSIIIEGSYDGVYIPIISMENQNVELNSVSKINVGINSNENQMVLPSSIRVKINTTTSTTYSAYITMM